MPSILAKCTKRKRYEDELFARNHGFYRAQLLHAVVPFKLSDMKNNIAISQPYGRSYRPEVVSRDFVRPSVAIEIKLVRERI